MDNIFKKSKPSTILVRGKNMRWLLIGITIFLVLIVLLAGGLWLYEMRFKNRIFLGIEVAGVSLGGKTIEQADVLLQAKVDALAKKGIAFSYVDKEDKILPIVVIDNSASQVYELWSYDIKSTVDQAYSLGREGNIWLKNINRLNYLLKNKTLIADYKINKKKIKQLIRDYFAEDEKPAKDADLVWKNNKIMISEEETGMVFDYELAINKLINNLNQIKDDKIQLILKIDEPQIIKDKVEFLSSQAKELLKLAPIVLHFSVPEYYQGRKRFSVTEWHINQQRWRDWLKIKLNKNQKPIIGIDEKKAKKYLLTIAETIDTPAQDAKFNVENGKVVEWQSSNDGFVLNINETLKQIDKLIINNYREVVELILTVQKSQITNEDVNTMGVKELFGVGESNFRGSPWNRRHNIATGAEALNGVLIAPNQEFSLLATLGEINAVNGYLPELVIKEGKTIPEYGGGLCQIGTTAFRLAINAGLPITERRNHSYRVGYYEPAGTDATIYDPWPDFKFLNDSQKYLLLQTRIEGDRLIFELWGTTDGRQVTTTTPVVYNIVKPEEPEYINTDELKPGEKKILEHAHNGADAYFERTITWPSSAKATEGKPERETIEEVWKSHYVPWREKWLIGIDPNQATSTEEVVSNE